MTTSIRRPSAFATRALLIALVASLVLAAPGAVLARKGGGSVSTSATVTAAPNPVAVYETLTISGSGYKATTQLQVQIVTATSIGYLYAASDSSGRFSLQTSIATAGTASVKVYESARRGFSLKASTSVTVQ